MNADRPQAIVAANTVTEDADEIDLGQLLSMLWTGRFVILHFVLGSCFAGILYLIAAQPVYEANGLVQVEQDAKSTMSGALGDLSSLLGAPLETEAEIQILQSRMVLIKVIDHLNLLVEAEPRYFPLFGAFIARHRAEGSKLAPPLFGLDRFAWGGEEIDVARLDVPKTLLGETFTLTALGQGHFRLSDPDDNEVLRGQIGQRAIGMSEDGPVSIFVRELGANPGTQFRLVRWTVQDVLKELGDHLQIAEQGKQSGVIGLTVAGPHPDYVADVIREIEDAYVQQNVERRSAEAQQSLEFLQKQLPEIRAKVDAAQAKLNAYQMKQGSVDVTKETELILQQSVDLETKRLELVGQRQQAIQRFTAQHPVVQALDAQIKGLEDEQASIKKRAESLPETQQEVLSLMRDLDVNTQIYTTLLNSTQELQVAKAGTVGNVRIIDYPIVPDEKSSPKSVLVGAICVALGLFLGTAYLFLQKILWHGVDRPDEVERALGLPTYAAIPYTSTQKNLAQAVRRKQDGSHILAIAEPDNVAIEALRSLRTSLQFALLESPNNIVMITGPAPGLGKSFISINLAAVLANSSKKVVVVDADLRRGHLHKYTGESAAPGLSDYVAGNADFVSIQRRTPLENLKLITNGTTPPNPSELLLNERFAKLLEALSKQNDLVIIDTPPVLPVTDASVVGRLAGCVLLVLKEGEHPMRMVEETVRRLRQAGVQIRGTVFNQVGQRGGGYHGYYYSSYGYSYSSKYSSVRR